MVFSPLNNSSQSCLSAKFKNPFSNLVAAHVEVNISPSFAFIWAGKMKRRKEKKNYIKEIWRRKWTIHVKFEQYKLKLKSP